MRSSDPSGHFSLEHAADLIDALHVVQGMKDDLRADVVGEVAAEAEGGALKDRLKIERQVILFNDGRSKLGQGRAQVGHRFGIDLNDP